MASVAEAIKAVDPDCQFVLTGEPIDAISFNAGFRVVTGADDSGTAILSDDPDDWGDVSWGTVKIKLGDLNAAEPLKLLREERNRRLAETDWWALPDSPTMTDAQTTYRQALRDITTHSNWPHLEDSDWPTKP